MCKQGVAGRKPQRSTNDRGYGEQHKKLRAEWAPKVAAGIIRCARTGLLIPVQGSPCPRCGKPITHGKPGRGWCGWDLGHMDGTGKRIYTGPELACANRATRAHRKAREQLGELFKRTSREW